VPRSPESSQAVRAKTEEKRTTRATVTSSVYQLPVGSSAAANSRWK
jgi:hypothetical protein